MSEAPSFYVQTHPPRHPTPTEVEALLHYQMTEYSCTLGQAEAELSQARIAVIPHYIPDCPGYTGSVIVVAWSGGPDCVDVYVWDKSQIDGTPKLRREKQQREWTADVIRPPAHRLQSQPRTVKRITVPDHEVPDSLLMLGENDNGIFYLDADTPRVYFRSCQGQWTLTVVAKADVSDVAAEYVQDFGEQGSDYTKDRLLDYIARLEGGLL
jgi:hypothetical protein